MSRSRRYAVQIPLSLLAFYVLFVLPDIDLGWPGGLAMLAAAWLVWYLLWASLRESAAAAKADDSMAPEASAIGRPISWVVIAWLVVMRVLRKRWRDTVEADERDRHIEARASSWARGGLSVFMLALAVMFAFTPLDHLRWARPMTLSNLFMAGLIASCLLEYVVTGMTCWLDRRSA
ncbi:hypothetical protein PY254_00560 [Rhodanobacter sp. AS-Z3]|uniref:hypothetical protein n=1 Tax=Rhodanobacter sp. AS-Z3 TaxID=3031330 RepID=UPI00247A5D43|nr:hypothetical protein [Rhodanobacter sp. AS-Z3]WEN15206.1 hypothetical protein PY254_00560 [Rhodanobacter sp. AS-Z3]